MDIFEFALEKEKLAHETYKSLAEKATSNSLKGILTLLAAEELRHVDMVRALQQNQQVAFAPTELLGEAKKVFEKIRRASVMTAPRRKKVQATILSYARLHESVPPQPMNWKPREGPSTSGIRTPSTNS